MKKIYLLLITLHTLIPSFALASEPWNTAKSMASFHISTWWNKYWYGNENFDVIIYDQNLLENEGHLKIDDTGTIISVQDKSPVFLGSIPQNQESIDAFKGDTKVGIYTFNRDFERYWAGLEALRSNEQNKKSVEWHRYDTTDFTSPYMVDLIRIVRDLEDRDTRGEQAAYIHCKAGRGRSAAGMAAYILYLAKQDGKINKVTVKNVEKYMQTLRPQVKLGHGAKENLKQLQAMLHANDFKTIEEVWKNNVQSRDEEIKLMDASNESLLSKYKGYWATAAVVGVAAVGGIFYASTKS